MNHMSTKKFALELPVDARSQKTTAVPLAEVANTEWATPVHIVGSTITLSSDIQFPALQSVKDDSSLAKLTEIDNELTGVNTKLAGTLKTQVTNWPTLQSVKFDTAQSVNVANFPGTQQVSGVLSVNNFPTSQVVSGSVTVSNLPVTQQVAGSVSISNLPATQNVADTVNAGKLDTANTRLSAIDTKLGGTLKTEITNLPVTQPVSGSVTVSNLPATQNVADVTARTSLSAIDTKLGGTLNVSDATARTTLAAMDTKLGGTLKTQITNNVTIANFPEVQKVALDTTNVVVPVELRGTDREFLFTTTSNLGANAVFTSPIYDVISVSMIKGLVSASHDGILFIQESDDQATWFTTTSQAIVPATSDTISSTLYYAGGSFDKSLVARYVRLVYVNGTTAQTRFTLSAYTSI